MPLSLRNQAVTEPVELPFIGRKLTATSDYDPTTHIAVGVDPGVTQAIKAGHAQRDQVTGQVLRQWEWELSKGQLKHDSGLTKAKQDTARWSAAIQPQLLQLAAATPAGTTLGGLHAHVLALKATWDALWEEYLKPRWRRQRLALHHAQERVIEAFCKKLLDRTYSAAARGHKVLYCDPRSGEAGAQSVASSYAFQPSATCIGALELSQSPYEAPASPWRPLERSSKQQLVEQVDAYLQVLPACPPSQAWLQRCSDTTQPHLRSLSPQQLCSVLATFRLSSWHPGPFAFPAFVALRLQSGLEGWQHPQLAFVLRCLRLLSCQLSDSTLQAVGVRMAECMRNMSPAEVRQLLQQPSLA
ncbi:hypothetical protein QJQ45_000412 [Haematococcus lacustris]|nr:hypothetical protein QJQ45_000412 [Haematococcus lacustris]